MAVESPDLAYKAKSLQIKSASIVNFKGDTINIEPFMTGFAIFENLMKKTMTMQIGIVDGVGLVERLPIVGDEIFILQISSSSFEDTEEAEDDDAAVEAMKTSYDFLFLLLSIRLFIFRLCFDLRLANSRSRWLPSW